jgi:hypothetical protein
LPSLRSPLVGLPVGDCQGRETSQTEPPARPVADPIFAAIENHKKLDRARGWIWNALPTRLDSGPKKRAILISPLLQQKTPSTKPTTAAGASALLAYITSGPITGLFELGETHWHETAFRTVVASLAKIARQSQRAA